MAHLARKITHPIDWRSFSIQVSFIDIYIYISTLVSIRWIFFETWYTIILEAIKSDPRSSWQILSLLRYNYISPISEQIEMMIRFFLRANHNSPSLARPIIYPKFSTVPQLFPRRTFYFSRMIFGVARNWSPRSFVSVWLSAWKWQ